MGTRTRTILIVDDDPQMQRYLRHSLEGEGYATRIVSMGQTAIDSLHHNHIDAVLLDVHLPDVDGFTICQRLRTFSVVPVILLSGRDQETDIIYGLNLGADDYLPKPFSVNELLARVRAVLRRAAPTTMSQVGCLDLGDLILDGVQHLVRRHGVEVPLSATEYVVLAYLAQHVGKVVPSEQLLEAVWGAEKADDRHVLQVTISRLRQKLEPDPAHPHYLQTKRGIGYWLYRETAQAP